MKSNKPKDAKKAWNTIREIEKIIREKVLKTHSIKGRKLTNTENVLIKEPRGYPDFSFLKRNELIYVELKSNTDRLNKNQRRKFKEIIGRGEKIYLIQYKKHPNKKGIYEILNDKHPFTPLDCKNIEKYSTKSKTMVKAGKRAWKTRKKNKKRKSQKLIN